MRDGIEWRVSEIYAVREAKLFNEEDVTDSDHNNILYDDIPVQEHPKAKSDSEIKQTYLHRFLAQRRRALEDSKMQGVEGISNPEANSDPENIDQEIENSLRYEYFIHYLGIDRRNDRWVTEQFIKIDPDEVQRQLELVKQIEAEKQNSYLPNDENHGMTEKEIADFI